MDGRRLVYKFGKNARGWRENESWIASLKNLFIYMMNSEDFGENTEDVMPMEFFFSYLGEKYMYTVFLWLAAFLPNIAASF